jgi:WD40 repeat protein
MTCRITLPKALLVLYAAGSVQGCGSTGATKPTSAPPTVANATPERATHLDIEKLKFTPDGRYFILTRWDSTKPLTTVEVWDFKLRALRNRWQVKGHVHSLDLSPDSQFVALGGTARGAEVWSLNGKFQRAYEGSGELVAYSGDGKQLAVGNVSRLGWLDLKTGRVRWEKPTSTPPSITGLWTSPDGKFLAAARDDISIAGNLCRFGHGESWSTLATGDGCDLEFSRDGRYLATYAEQGLFVSDVRMRKVLRTLEARDYWTYNVEFSPDGHYLVDANLMDENGTGIWVWDWRRNKLVRSMRLSGPGRFSKDGMTFVCVDGEKGKLVFLPSWQITGKDK